MDRLRRRRRQSGLPFTPTYSECGSDQDLDNNAGQTGATSDCRLNKVASGAALSPGVGSYDPVTHTRPYFAPVAPLAANGVSSGPFQRPTFGTFGNIGRNSYYGPSEYFADASLQFAAKFTF